MPSWWSSLWGNAGDGELGAPDLRARVVDAIAAMAERDDHGHEVLPDAVRVHISAPAGRLDLARRFVEAPEWEPALEEALLNRLYGAPRERLPLRRYTLREDAAIAVSAAPEAPGPLAWLEVRGGDRDGTRSPVPPLRRAFLLGRGERHGDAGMDYNDLVLSQDQRYVSRRAAAIHRQGARLFVEVREQAECLVLERGDGARLRPYNSAGRRAELRPGDRLLFTDGGAEQVELRVLAADPAGETP